MHVSRAYIGLDRWLDSPTWSIVDSLTFCVDTHCIAVMTRLFTCTCTGLSEI